MRLTKLFSIRKGTRGTYKSGWCQFKTFCESRGINPQWAPVPLIVKFICHLFEVKVSCSVVNTAISAISKYHVVDKDTGTPVGQHSLVTMAKKAFWQQRPPIPKYHATYDVSVVLRYIESLGVNEVLSIKQLSEKIAFLVVFLTLSRYCLVSHLTKMTFPYLLLFSLLLDCPTQSEQYIGLGVIGS